MKTRFILSLILLVTACTTAPVKSDEQLILEKLLPIPKDFKPNYSNLKAAGFAATGCYVITAIVDMDTANSRKVVDDNAKYIFRELYRKNKTAKAFMLKIFQPGKKMAFLVVTFAPMNDWFNPCLHAYELQHFEYGTHFIDWDWNKK